MKTLSNRPTDKYYDDLDDMFLDSKPEVSRYSNSPASQRSEFNFSRLEPRSHIANHIKNIDSLVSKQFNSLALPSFDDLVCDELIRRIVLKKASTNKQFFFELLAEIEADQEMGKYYVYKIEEPFRETKEISIGGSNSVKNSSPNLNEENNFENNNSDFWETGRRIIALACGGASLGGVIAQIPGAIIGSILGGVVGLVVTVSES